MKPPISEDSLDRYARIIRALIPNADGVSVCSADGIAIQSLDLAGDAELLPAIERLTARRPDWASKRPIQLQAAPGEERSLLTAGLCDIHGKVIAAVAVLTNGQAQHDSLAPLLSCVSECIQHEMVQDLELDSIADELMERYEELNLVYHTEDQVNYFRQGREALESLTKNCLDYLDVGLSVMILKEKSITISCSNKQKRIPNASFVKSHLASSLYEWVSENNDTAVINEMSDPMAVSLMPGVPCRVLCCPILDNGGDVVGILATVNDYAKARFSNSDKNLLQVMSRKASKIVVANYDALTGLVNRSGYEYFLENALANAQSGEVDTSLLHINIDQLHIINDTISHAAGDAVIKSVAATLESQIRDGDALSRVGGDEFGVILQDCSLANAADFADRICRRIANIDVDFEGESYSATVSIGVAMIAPTSENVAQIVSTAELACSVAKDQGQNRIEIYRQDDADMIRREEQMHLVADIQRALADDRFELYGQPIQSLAPDNRSHHTEILLRLLDENGEIIGPDNFIPAAERYHLMPAIDRWVVSKTLAMLSEFDAAQLRTGVYAVNLSGQSFCDKDFLRFVHRALAESRVPAECICFEITETAAVSNLTKAIRFMIV